MTCAALLLLRPWYFAAFCVLPTVLTTRSSLH
jgi:hypothetical protein